MTPSALSNETLDELLAAAGAATPGRRAYVHDEDRDDYLLVCEPNDTPLGRFDACLDAEFAAECTPERITALITELLLHRSEGVAVKPLIWAQSSYGGQAWRSHSMLGIHKVYSVGNGKYGWAFEGYDGTETIERASDEATAFAAAQLDYETRIKSALSPSTERAETIEGWQPIETAPKDGTEIVAWGTMAGDYGYTPDEQTWTGVSWTNGRWVVTKPTGRYFRGFTPTHWRPPPEPPRALNPSGSGERG